MIENLFQARTVQGSHVEYYRDFCEGDRKTRVTLLFERPHRNLGETVPRFLGTHISVTQFWPQAKRADLAQNAPLSIRDLLDSVHGQVDQICTQTPVSLVRPHCSICGLSLQEFKKSPEGLTCLNPLDCPNAL